MTAIRKLFRRGDMASVRDGPSALGGSERVELIDVDISAVPVLPVLGAGQRHRLTFWCADCPVGHCELEPASGPLDAHDWQRLVAGSVAPDVIRAAQAIVAREAVAPASALTASLVICTRDRPEQLARCLASIPQQTRAPTEVIVVDNASRDTRTRDAALAANVVYVREHRPGLDYARNAGARAARGDIVAYTDDDVRLHPRWLERMVAAFDGPSIAAVTGLVLPAELETLAQRHFETHWGFGRGYRRIDFGADFFAVDRTRGYPVWEIGAGASMAFRREIFRTAGLFDERLDVGRAGCSGDSEFWHRVLTHGGVCRYEPSAVVFHYHRRDWAGLSRQIYGYMRGHAAALMVQYERSGHLGNLRRVGVTMPLYFARRVGRLLASARLSEDRFLHLEISGFLSGLVFYARSQLASTASGDDR